MHPSTRLTATTAMTACCHVSRASAAAEVEETAQNACPQHTLKVTFCTIYAKAAPHSLFLGKEQFAFLRRQEMQEAIKSKEEVNSDALNLFS